MKAIRFCVALFLILSLISLLLTAVLFFIRENEKEKRIALEKDVARLNETIGNLNEKIGSLNKEKTDLSTQLNEQVELVNSYKIKLREQKSLVAEKEKALDTANKELEGVRDEYSKYKIDTAALVNEYKQQSESLQGRIALLEKKSSSSAPVSTPAGTYQQSTQFRPASTFENVELEPVVVRPNATIHGTVEVVNRNFNFVVSNIGRVDGLSVGDTLRVMRDGNQIATVRVEKLYENLSASAIENENNTTPIQEGDSVER